MPTLIHQQHERRDDRHHDGGQQTAEEQRGEAGMNAHGHSVSVEG